MKYRLELLLLIMILSATAALAQHSQSSKPVTVSTLRVENSFRVEAHNNHSFSVTLTLRLTGENVETDRSPPLTVVVPGNGSKYLLTVKAADQSKSFSFDNQYTWFAGDVYARHDDSYVYRLPFESGTSYKVAQAYHGTFSHQGNSAFALDFIMPEGTEVLSARSGVVTQIREDSDRGGSSDAYVRASNFIVIEHSDGTLGEYAHLRKDGVLVEPGERVRKGQLIGYSGNTGYSSGPHLHFMVTKVLSSGHSRSLPVKFRTQEGLIKEFEKGEHYTAR